MPFTFSHPAAVLPLLALPQRWRSATGLIIGSMTPDFEKFLRMSTEDPYSHTWRSIFYFNLPLGLLLTFLFHMAVRNALIMHLPGFIRQRFSRFLGFNWRAHFARNFGVVVLSLVIGTVSHIAIDSFTHKGGLGVQLFPFLETKLIEAKNDLYLFELLQTTTSVLGAGVILFVIFRLRKMLPPNPPTSANIFKYWLTLLAVTVLVLVLKATAFGGLDTQSLYHLSIPVISAGLISLVVTSAYFKSKLHL